MSRTTPYVYQLPLLHAAAARKAERERAARIARGVPLERGSPAWELRRLSRNAANVIVGTSGPLEKRFVNRNRLKAAVLSNQTVRDTIDEMIDVFATTLMLGTVPGVFARELARAHVQHTNGEPLTPDEVKQVMMVSSDREDLRAAVVASVGAAMRDYLTAHVEDTITHFIEVAQGKHLKDDSDPADD